MRPRLKSHSDSASKQAANILRRHANACIGVAVRRSCKLAAYFRIRLVLALMRIAVDGCGKLCARGMRWREHGGRPRCHRAGGEHKRRERAER
jgi:hypothetical protein